jgi:hypothetical protein
MSDIGDWAEYDAGPSEERHGGLRSEERKEVDVSGAAASELPGKI